MTGAWGFIGRHLSRHLASCGWRVAGLGHGVWAPSESSAWGLHHWLSGEVNLANLARMERDYGSPEVIFHLAGGSSVGAALSNPRDDFRRTVVSTSEVLEWMRLSAKGARLVAVSSAAVYGAAHKARIPEEASTEPLSAYGQHKLMMEKLCRSYATDHELKVALPRLFSVYGCGLRKQLLWDLCEKIAEETRVNLGGSGDELRDWTHVSDVVRGLEMTVDIASVNAPSINLASGRGTNVREVASTVAACWADAGRVQPGISFSGLSRPGDPFSLVADTSRGIKLGFVCKVSIEEGIRAYVQWYKERGLHESPKSIR